MKKFSLILLLSFITAVSFAQSSYTLTGRIIDEATRQPLQGASVFAENTTIGTATDNDGVFNLKLPNGGYSIVITFTGYNTETKRVTTADAGVDIVIDLKKKEKSMDEFVVKATYEVADGLEKYGDFFLENFIGKTANSRLCELKNKEALKFYYYRRTNRLKILATEPLEIVNNALGYTIKYELDSFVHEYNTQISLYTGYPLFQEMETSSLDQLLKWNAARKVAYNGSILHFMRSMYQKKLKEEGFEIQFIISDKNKERAVLLKDFYAAVNYRFIDSSNTVAILPQQKDMAVLYKNEESPELYVVSNPEASRKFQLSVLSFLPGEYLDIEQNGFYFEQNDLTITGYWAWEKVGDMLPYDFKEKTTVTDKKDVPVATTMPVTIKKDSVTELNPQNTIPLKTTVTQAGAGQVLLTSNTWKMEESRVIDGNDMKYYKRGGNENSINFDNDLYKFNADLSGTYFYNGQEYRFTWKYTDAGKTKIEMIIQYPSPLIVTLENVMVTADTLRYTRLQQVNGINMVAIETRTIK